MKTLVAIGIAALTLPMLTSPSWADPGGRCHFHGNKPASAETVSGCASQRKAQRIKQGKLDASWGGVKPSTPEQVDGKKGREWRLTFHNPSAADKSKQMLYMFYTLPGNFVAANFTGQ